MRILARGPRRHAWFAAVLGLLTLAHMWSHAVQVADHVTADALMAASHPGHDHDHDHDDHGEQAHSHPFVATATNADPPGQSNGTAVAVLPADAERDAVPLPMGRAPPGGHRGRAALTRTLEVCRC
ncbi:MULTISPECIES: hypothetical protein [unclassified Nonomuraea]|uniref:hypothetical protein n=1 Tax=unclassified Nonomuraea TaxID=2593643 RepID=UPI0035BF2E52